MTKIISALAIIACWTLSLASVTGQTNSAPDPCGAQGTYTTQNRLSGEAAGTAAPADPNKKKAPAKAKHPVKPAPSKEELEFERVLQGIFG